MPDDKHANDRHGDGATHRGRALTEEAQQSASHFQLVTFVVAGEEFAVPILRVQEIIRPIDITRVPHAPAFVKGVVNLRGRIVPIVDLRTRFSISPPDDKDDTRILMVELDGKIVGLVTDAVREVLRVEEHWIEPAPDIAVGVDARYVRGIAKLKERLLILLDVTQLMAVEDIDALGDREAQLSDAMVAAGAE